MTIKIEELLLEQNDTAGKIQRFMENTNKIGKNKLTAGLYGSRQELLASYWTTFYTNHRILIRQQELEETDYYKNKVFDAVEIAYCEAAAELAEAVNKLLNPAAPDDNSTAQSATRPLPTSADAIVKQIQLPKITLPTFNGDPLLWESFRDQFKSLVHELPGLSKVHKLLYLKSSLTGDAAECIKNTQITDNGYIGAWEDLKLRYENTRVLSASYMRNLFSIPNIKKSNATDIKRLLDTFKQIIRALTALKKPIAAWDEIFVYILSQKLDNYTRMAWETSLEDSRSVPTFQQLSDFLENRVHALESARSPDPMLSDQTHREKTNHSNSSKSNSSNNQNSKSSTFTTHTGKQKKPTSNCKYCSESHVLSYCPRFQDLSVPGRREFVVKEKLCTNCLKPGHLATDCKSTSRCLVCRRSHNTLLHENNNSWKNQNKNSSLPLNRDSTSSHVENGSQSSSCNTAADTSNSTVCASSTNSVVLLATAQVRIQSSNGKSVVVRALLDTASDSTFVSEWVSQTLRLPRESVSVSVSGIQGCNTGKASAKVQFNLCTVQRSNFSMPVSALVLKKITGLTPSRSVTLGSWSHLVGLNLADPTYTTTGRIDLLLGSDFTGFLLQDESRKGSFSEPVARLTPFGWVLTGQVEASQPQRPHESQSASVHHANINFNVEQFWDLDEKSQHPCIEPSSNSLACISNDESSLQVDDLSLLLQKFWELEEVTTTSQLTPEEKECESHFENSHTRDSTGRYVVRLPFKLDPFTSLESNRAIAAALLLSTEKRLQKDPTLLIKYKDFMSEYLALGHMESADLASSEPSYFLPHHGVFKSLDMTKKLRVVFNASFKTKSGLSLNDCLMTGPKLQPDLWMILTRWRLCKIALTADIVKMFRQIRVHSSDLIWQRIFWRPDPLQQLKEFLLSTVTYGTACAPYLALRVLRQLAIDERSRFPLGAEAIVNSSYVDDFFVGADDEIQASELKNQLVGMLQAGGFSLDKWASNFANLCPGDKVESKLLQEVDGVSTLGILWHPKTDEFSLRVSALDTQLKVFTKRSVLSDIARLFDPLGWFAPVLVSAKIFLQDMWIAGLEWDQELPAELQNKWIAFRSELPFLENIKIPRWVNYNSSSKLKFDLHAFSDASERAYSAVIYLCVRYPNGDVFTNLLVAKTKVAPVKTISIPRLELCGALLLSRLANRVKEGLNFKNVPIYAWTDSQVTLIWIRSHASKWSPFVANRVATIQAILPAKHWRHVRTSENPADCATRGVTSEQLLDLQIWWQGPDWLKSTQFPHYDLSALSADSSELEYKNKATALSTSTNSESEMLLKYSQLIRLVRVSAWCLRFLHNSNTKRRNDANLDKIKGPLTSLELKGALIHWIKIAQHQFFTEEVSLLSAGKPLPRSSHLLTLHPFLDQVGLLRVGGRLQKAHLSFDEKHPIIMDKRSYLSTLLVRDAHLRTLHGGPQLTRSHLLRRYWIPHSRNLVKAIIKLCVICTRHAGQTSLQIMGSLPANRLLSIRPFMTTGVDFAGPLVLRTAPGRGHKAYKGYISLFVCLATKSIHLEAVSDLTSQAFLAAFKRFVSRRGMCQTMISDNGTNFHGADKELRLMLSAASTFYKESFAVLANDGVDWTFIPPTAPHFGGLWEAGVKSVKYHLRRVIGATTLTYEEMSTLLCQIEACLNSRPLYEISSNSSDILPLTPGHFLIGQPTTVVPEPGFIDLSVTPTTRWRMISQMRDDFWQRWSREYLQGLQPRHIWRKEQTNLKVGSVVLIKNDQSPPATWPLARVTELHPGSDGLVRVVTLKAGDSIIKRPIVKICPLPVAEGIAAPAPSINTSPSTSDASE